MNLGGKFFGELKVLALFNVTPTTKGRKWFCKCSCGTNTVVHDGNLKQGHTRSCGHLGLTNAKTTHGESHRGHQTIEWWAYHNAKARCKATHKQHKDYFDRGILFKFKAFAEFLNALRTKSNPSGRRPSPAHSIDRRNNDKGYQKGNIRWATRFEQNHNRGTHVASI